MEKLDQLITKFKEVKKELEKSNVPLHNTVEGFMGGLKTHPKGSAERAKFITKHMGHGPFLSSLNAHPQGKQLHTMLMGHLNSPANAGPKAYGGGNVSVAAPVALDLKKSEEDPLEELEKFYVAPYVAFGKSIISEDQARAKAMGAPTNSSVMKDEDEDEEDTEKTEGIRPEIKESMDRAIAAYAGKSTKPVASSGSVKTLQPIKKKDEDDDKTAASPPKLNAHGKAIASAPKEAHAGQHIAVGDNLKGHRGDPNQSHTVNSLPVSHQMADIANRHTGVASPVATSIPKIKPAGAGLHRVGSNAPTPQEPSVVKPPTVSLKPPKLKKTTNSSYAPDVNMVKEELTLNKGGQWNIAKTKKDAC